MKSVVSEKGQVTIPKLLRERLGIRPGHILDFKEDQGHLVAEKTTPEDPVELVYGIIKISHRVDKILTSLRGSVDAV